MKKGLNPDVVYKKIQVSVPENVDRLVKELCRLDGSNIEEFYQDMFLDGLRAYLDTGELFNLEGLARIHRLHEVFSNLDESMYGTGGETEE